ncbi:unnamed protein product [Ceutorhynchus assimilis]|uniref:Gamma-interferon-inducible lysosomal thiol reductase n=1 Tax=Ceutorhynchus assimilis TaxID=467358 RepID=A0A9N9MVB8_9CUCU|nr:unnamed protein product [Ceutorhynchus assimilis]
MNSLYIFFAVVIAVTNGKSLGANNTLTVQVYYETLGQDSKHFITTQLYPTFVQLGRERIALELIPYGHTSEGTDGNGNKTFTCPHGPEECYGNKVHACFTNLAFTKEGLLQFVYCSELSNTPANNTVLQTCAHGVGFDWKLVEDCLSSGKADELLSENGRKTALVNAPHIPTVVFNGNSYPERESVLNNFKQTVCELVDCIY